MNTPSMQDLLEAGVHFGHQVRRWNPKMKPYIYGEKDGVHIIDLAKTVEGLAAACEFFKKVGETGETVLYVGTKRQAQEIIKAEAQRAGALYVASRWIGGLLTNFEIVAKNIKKLLDLESQRESGGWDGYTKKERVLLSREIEKLDDLYGGLRDLGKLPAAIFIVDIHKEISAAKEAAKKGIPVAAICDTNVDPGLVDYPIAANDDAIKSIEVITKAVTDSYMEGKAVFERKQAKRPATTEGTEAKAATTEDTEKTENTEAKEGGSK